MSMLSAARSKFHGNLITPPNGPLSIDQDGIVSIADSSSVISKSISKNIAEKIGPLCICKKIPGQTAGTFFEISCESFLKETFFKLDNLRPGKWIIQRTTDKTGTALASFEQYEHLKDLENVLKRDSLLAASLGSDYTITPDIIIAREPEEDEFINSNVDIVDPTVAEKTGIRKTNNEKLLLHASISCKWTLRSDRAQNSRSEALNLIRNRKGRSPHIVVLTAEPLPSRIASIALGTGDIDCVYHFALPELMESVRETRNEEAMNILNIMVQGKRLRDISDLPLDLAI